MAGELLNLIKVSAVLTYVSIGIYVSTVRDQFRVGRVVLYRLTTLVGRLLVPSLYVWRQVVFRDDTTSCVQNTLGGRFEVPSCVWRTIVFIRILKMKSWNDLFLACVIRFPVHFYCSFQKKSCLRVSYGRLPPLWRAVCIAYKQSGGNLVWRSWGIGQQSC